MNNNNIFINVVLISALLISSGLKAEYTILDASGDAEIDSYYLYRDVPLSVYTGGGAFTELRIERYDPNYYPEDPGATYSSALIKWDLSNISPSHRITAVTLELTGWYAYQGQIAVYGIQTGNWVEDTITWNIWEATPKTLVYLGNLSPAGNVETNGRTTFTDPDLTAWVQSWVDGTQANYGIILKMPENSAAYGASFSSREDTYMPELGLYYDPQLKITHELATSSLNGKVIINGFTGD
ncbi:MAG: DNRLRE domain-containing protein, partial [Phycisphaerales bacterium]